MLKYKQFWNKLSYDVQANLKFAQYVSKGDPIHQYYFFGEYSETILSWILFKVYDHNATPDAEREILGPYYEFVAEPIVCNVPQWYQLTSYQGLNDQKLHSWLRRNGAQWFTRFKIAENKRHETEIQLPENTKLSSLLYSEGQSEGLSDEELNIREKLDCAWNALSAKDQETIIILIIKKKHWSEAWDILNVYIEPKDGREAMINWTPKVKQDALARLKKRALQHLINKFNR